MVHGGAGGAADLDVLGEAAVVYNDFDMIFDPDLSYHQLFTTQHMLCDMIYLAPPLIGC